MGYWESRAGSGKWLLKPSLLAAAAWEEVLTKAKAQQTKGRLSMTTLMGVMARKALGWLLLNALVSSQEKANSGL